MWGVGDDDNLFSVSARALQSSRTKHVEATYGPAADDRRLLASETGLTSLLGHALAARREELFARLLREQPAAELSAIRSFFEVYGWRLVEQDFVSRST